MKNKELLIDNLHKALTDLGLDVEREGWKKNQHSKPLHDNCEWLDVNLSDKDGNRIIVHFYFTHNKKKLTELQVWKANLVKEFDVAYRISQ